MLVAKRYAKALFNLSKDQQCLDAVALDFEMLKRLIIESKDFYEFINHPRISSIKRCDILNKLFSGKIHDKTLKFLFFITEHRRISKLGTIAVAFEELYFVAKGTVAVKFTSHEHLEDESLKFFCQSLKSKINKEIRPSLKVDKSLIGGIKIQIGDQIHDGTIKAILNKFQQNIMHA